MSKKTLILGAILIILIGLAYLYQGPLKQWQNNLGRPNNFLAKTETGKIDKIEIVSANNTVVLAKLGEKWKYNNTKDFYVDPAVIADILAELNQAAKSKMELVSNNQERKSEFQTDVSGLDVKVYQAEKLAADFIVGGRGGDYNSSYISTPESANTYLLAANLTDVFNQAEWRDLTIFSSDKTKINKIRFQYPNREFTVEFKAGQWAGVLPVKFNVNQEKIEKIIEIMATLKAVEIPEQTFNNTGLEKHLAIIQATGDGVNNVLMFGEPKNGLYYAKKGDSDNIYLIENAGNKNLYSLLNQTISQLK